ncbi:MAG: hypothetical protein LBM63_01690 [Rikenellaceae bacterium]|jgi:hypothetical protein|nr:hypothetical protein [Rikenellaceae bacterium]
MKKILLIGILGLCGLTMTKCITRDYGCEYYFYVANTTATDVFFTTVKKTGREYIISPNDELRISSRGGECGKRETALDDQFPDEEMIIQPLPNTSFTIQIKVGDEIMPDIIMKRKYWKFTTKGNYRANYTLVITDELVEELSNQ